jgi:hypothetical protein
MENFTEVYKNKNEDRFECHNKKIRLYRNAIFKESEIIEHSCQFCNTEDDVYKYREKHFSSLLDEFHITYNIDYNNIKVFNYKNEWILIYNNIECLEKWKGYYLQNVEYMFLCVSCNKERNQNYRYKICVPINTNETIVHNEDKTDKIKSKRIIMSTLRNLINHDTRKFREMNKIKICELCSSLDNIHVDHYLVSFIEILNNFLELTEINFFEIDSIANVHTFKKTMEHNKINIAQIWIEYHNEKAKYRFLCRSCNSKVGTYNFKDKHCRTGIKRGRKKKKLKEVTIQHTDSCNKNELIQCIEETKSCAKIISVQKKSILREINIF